MDNFGIPSRLKYLFPTLLSLSCFGLSCAYGDQAVSEPAKAKADYSAEAFVIENARTEVAFEDNGNYRREFAARVRIQSGAGVQRYSVLTFPYQNSTEVLDIQYVRVLKPDGTVVPTPADVIQDMPSEITRQAPFYSDLREKHVAVKGLGVGDVVEFVGVWHTNKPLIPGQFWYAYNLDHDNIILREQLEIRVPRNRPVKWKSAMKPTITSQSETQVFTWTHSQLEHKSSQEERKDKELAAYDGARGKNPPPEIQLSSFQSWEEIGRWYASLERDRVKATPEIRAKAAEITKALTDENAKVRAIYAFVSTQFRYIGVAFGVGRYQPHFASEVLSNQYGDCKDKHTLLASLLDAVGVKAYPALISSAHDLDVDVPYPAQFDHVISSIPKGDHFLWLDTTPELAPPGYLIGVLRDKPALVIAEGKPPLLTSTPADAPTKSLQTFRIDAKLTETGTLQGKVQRTLEGDDNALLVRAAFRSLPLPQWTDLIQQLSILSGFGGDVSEATATSPEKTEEPFRIDYSYTKKDFGDWPNRRIVAPLPVLGLPAFDDKDGMPPCPIWLGSPSMIRAESHLQLPKGYAPDMPLGVDVNENFAEYHASHRIKDGVLISERKLVVKEREVPIAEYEAYKKFSKVVADDYAMFIALSPSNSPVSARLNALWTLPSSDNADALEAFNQAVGAFQRQDVQGGIGSLKHAVELDRQFTRAWVTLAQAYASNGDRKEAVQAYQNALKADPQQPLLYEGLAFVLGMYKAEEAVAVWQEVLKNNQKSARAWEGLGSSLYRSKRYMDAAAALQSAADLDPDRPNVKIQLASAYLHTGEDQKALKTYREALELDRGPAMLNSVGYELADANKDLPDALKYAEEAVLREEEASQDVELDELSMEDLEHTRNLPAYWDTLGWVHFRIGNFAYAEKYLNCAWKLGQAGLIADHLGEVYERENKKQAAVRMYKIALHLYKSASYRDDAELVRTEERLERLTPGKSVTERYDFNEASDEVNRTRTTKLGRSIASDATAQFFLVFERDAQTSGTKLQGMKFVSGSDELKSANPAVESAKFDVSFPDDGPTRLLRRGILSCYKGAGCSFTLINPGDVRSLN